MVASTTIAVDAMGGDFGPTVTVPAALAATKKFPDLNLILVGDQATLESCPGMSGLSRCSQIDLHHAPDVVALNSTPSEVLRGGDATSMVASARLVVTGKAQAMLSGGNTGALMAIGRHTLGMLPHIARPAICATIPADNGPVYLLDLGANVDSPAEHLVQFAHMGSMLATALEGPHPKVALLSNGSESGKGNEQVRRAAELLAVEPKLNYVGYIEADGLLRGDVDVVVCDGFVGNIALKTMEATAAYVNRKLREKFDSSYLHRILGRVTRLGMHSTGSEPDVGEYNGACFLGLRSVLVKSHGNATAAGFFAAISHTRRCVGKDISHLITMELNNDDKK